MAASPVGYGAPLCSVGLVLTAVISRRYLC